MSPARDNRPGACFRGERPRLLRRLGAILYDGLLLLAVWFFAALPLPLVPESIRVSTAGRLGLQCYLLVVAFGFFGWFWTHGGQTLGMRAWRIRLVASRGETVDWARAGRRFAAALLSWACLGLGFLTVLTRHDRLAWHDRLSGTELEMHPADRSLSETAAAPDSRRRSH